MASDLKWRTGFDWGSVLFFAFAALSAWLLAGIARFIGIGAAIAAAGYMAYRYRKWNGAAWRRVHFRAMLAYAGIAEREQTIARQADTVFDPGKACAQLALLLCGEDKTGVVDAMLADLTRQQGAFLAGLVERHAAEILPGSSVEFRRDVTASLRRVRLSPELVIASVIENTYGGAEAARYAVALVTGDAN